MRAKASPARWLCWPLDHVLHSPDFLPHRLQQSPACGSGHFPILIELVVHPRAAVVWNVEA